MKTNLRGPESNGVRNVAIDQLLQIIEFTDDGHSLRTADLVSEMLRLLGLSGSAVGEISLAARMHDVGKRFVNPRILDKPGPLNIEEHSEMEQHVWHGFPSLTHRAEPLPAVCTQVALLHHERLDGSGYPFQLRGSAVPFAARVVAVADVFDALASERPYKQAWPMSAAVGYLAERSGTEFDRRCVSALHSVLGLQRVAAAVPVRSIAVGPAAATTFGFAGA